MRFGFAAPPVPGHLNPMIALGSHLKSRGHEVVFFNFPDTELRFREVILPFGAKQFPPGDLARRVAHLSRLTGAEAWQFSVQQLMDSCLAALEDGARVIRESQVDALILDTLQRGFDLVAMHLRVPYVHVSNALHFDYWGSRRSASTTGPTRKDPPRWRTTGRGWPCSGRPTPHRPRSSGNMQNRPE